MFVMSCIFFFKQKTAYEMRISDWSSDVCSSDLWQGKLDMNYDGEWLIDALKEKISSIDWSAAASDVARCLRPTEAKSLSLWSERFFQAKVSQLATA